MDKPLISIIIPAYNHSLYIENCLDSIINQTYENIELIILNDGSTDDTNEKILNYENKLNNRFKRYKYINKENEGICKTLNLGLSISKGKYIIPFASDDVMYPERVEKQIDFLEKNSHYGMVYTDGYDIRSDDYLNTDNRYDDNLLFSQDMDFAEGDLFDYIIDNVFLLPVITTCMKRECYKKVGFYDESILSEDIDMLIRISKHYEIGYIKEPLTIHRLHGRNSGRNSTILEQSVKTLIVKYGKSDLLNDEQKQRLILLFEKVIGVINLSKINNYIKGKKVIAWGTGMSYQRFKSNYNADIDFFIDSDIKKQGKLIDDKYVYPPSKLLEINKGEYYVFVLSQFYKEIYHQLETYGFEYRSNYY